MEYILLHVVTAMNIHYIFKLFLPYFYINLHHFYFITFFMPVTLNLSLHVITSLYMRNLMLGLVFVVHSHSAQRSWENTLKTIHLDGCCLLSCVWSWIHVGCSRGQFQGGEGRWADDGMQWLPVWGMEWADKDNTLWEMGRQIRSVDSYCSNWPYPRQAGGG